MLYKRPTLHKKLPGELEELAQAIVASGRMRLDAGDEANFCRILLPGVLTNQSISLREMENPALLERFRQRLHALISNRAEPGDVEQQVQFYLQRARDELQKCRRVTPELELMMARAFVLCNELPVIRLIYLEDTEIFISYGQSVGDVMDVTDWKQFGSNSGMQSVGSKRNAVYVSCGGHPFLDDSERNHDGDGFPALARFMVIAAQETGHNADMIRNANGQWTGRHSAKDWSAAPSDTVGIARKRDMIGCTFFFQQAQDLGLASVAEWERHLRFYREQNVGGRRRIAAWLKSKLGWRYLRFMMAQRGMKALLSLPPSPYPAAQVITFFQDMLFNLSPEADVYQDDNPLKEEAIACIEALARVPQQVIKWGHHATYCCTPNLYGVYYHTVVPDCRSAIIQMARKEAA